MQRSGVFLFSLAAVAAAAALDDVAPAGTGDVAAAAAHVDLDEDEASSFMQGFLAQPAPAAPPAAREKPFIIGLRRESVPIYRRGKVASYKTSYSGLLRVGTPAQEFRVVFDTGSGHVILPAAECQSEACMVEGRRKFAMRDSETAVAVNTDGSVVPDGEPCDSVTIGFGTGQIQGELIRDRVCFGAGAAGASGDLVAAAGASDAVVAATRQLAEARRNGDDELELCVEMSVVLAVEMSNKPFKSFRFDGILGLGLGALALNSNYSALEMLLGRGLPMGHFGVFLTEGENGEESEIALGGADPRRMLGPLHWAPVVMAEHGHWMVEIVALRLGGKTLDLCKDGTCRGVVDTGTSHLGVPAAAHAEVAEALATEVGEDVEDCRYIEGPELEIVLPGHTLTMRPHNYMRRLPILEGVSVSSATGVTVDSEPAPAAASTAAAAGARAVSAASAAKSTTAAEEGSKRRFCQPRTMPVKLPAPLGPKLFILGEPLLHRYYTVYDWVNHRVGFSVSNSRANTQGSAAAPLASSAGAAMPAAAAQSSDSPLVLMQQELTIDGAGALDDVAFDEDSAAIEQATVFMQVELKVSVRRRQRHA